MPGPPVLVVPADVRFMTREVVLMGVIMLEEPDPRDVFDCELGSSGWGSAAAFGTRSLLENRPMSAVLVLPVDGQWRSIGKAAAVCRWPCRVPIVGLKKLS